MSYGHAAHLLPPCAAAPCPRPGLIVDDTDPAGRLLCARHALTATQEAQPA